MDAEHLLAFAIFPQEMHFLGVQSALGSEKNCFPTFGVNFPIAGSPPLSEDLEVAVFPIFNLGFTGLKISFLKSLPGFNPQQREVFQYLAALKHFVLMGNPSRNENILF